MRTNFKLTALLLLTCGTLLLLLTAVSRARAEVTPAKFVSLETVRKMRTEAAHRKRRIIMDSDSDDAVYWTKEPTPDSFLSVRTAAVPGTMVDTLVYSTMGGIPLAIHNTKVGEVFVSKERMFAKNVTPDLIKQGTDPLREVVNYCRKNKIEVFWSMRMNDIHDGHNADYSPFLLPRFKKEHPDYLVGAQGNPPKRGFWTAVDYSRPEVRDLVFRLSEEVSRNYDIDGIMLDFFRHPLFFKSVAWDNPVSQPELDMMTDLMRQIRKMADRVGAERGRSILIAIRIPDSVEYCRGIGLDLERWLSEGLVDLMSTTDYFQLNPWEYTVQLGHKYHVPVYPCLTDARIPDEDDRFSRLSNETYRARAMQVWQAGADGIYTFNYANARLPFYREAGDPQVLGRLDKTYFASFLGSAGASSGPDRWLLNGSRFRTAPVLSPSDPSPLDRTGVFAVDIPVGDNLEQATKLDLRPKIKCWFQLSTALEKPEQLAVKLNGVTLRDGDAIGNWIRYPAAPETVRQGDNHFEISLAGRTWSKDGGPLWNASYQGTALPKTPWKGSYISDDSTAEIRDGKLFLADRSDGQVYYWYPWNNSPAGKTTVETRMKLVSTGKDGGVDISFSNGADIELLSFFPDRIQTGFSKLSCPINTTDDFHTYRVVFKDNDFKIYVDGRLSIDGAGKFTQKTTDNLFWFGSGGGVGTGESYWEFVRFSGENIPVLLSDLVLTIRYNP